MSSKQKILVSTCTLALLTGVAPYASAQTTGPARSGTPDSVNTHTGPSATGRRGIEEVLVTARRRRESSQTTPVAVTALSSAALTQQGITQVEDLNSQVPGFRFTQEGGENNNDVILRGLSRIPLGLGLPAVVTYEDDVPLPGIGSNRPIYDLANIQVLKGPQGTLFGRNTLGGAVLLNTVQPSDKFGGFIDGQYGNLNDKQVDGAINLPIVPGVLDLRVAAHYRREDGYVTALNSNARLSDIAENAVRVSLLYHPTDWFKNTMVYEYLTAPENAAGEHIIGLHPGVVPGLSPLIDPQLAAYAAENKAAGPWTQFTDNSGEGVEFRRETSVVNDTRIDLTPDLTVRNIVGYERVYDHEVINTGAVPPLSVNVGFGPTPFTLFDAAQLVHQEYITEEVQVLGKALDNKLNWIVGGFFNHDDSIGGAGTQFTAFSIGGLPSNPTTSLYTDNNYAIYGQGGLDLSEWVLKGLTLNVGYRYSWDQVHACGGSALTYVDSNQCEILAMQHMPGGFGDIGNEGAEPSWTFGLDYKYSPHQFFYVTTRRGYRGVGVNTPLFSSPYTTGGTVVPPYPGGPGCSGPGNVCPDLRPFQKTGPEKLTDVEIGSKTDFSIGSMRARFDIDAYWEKYNGALQFFNVLGTGIYTGAPDLPNDQSVGINAADETIEGIELGLTIKPIPQLTLSFNGAYTNAKVDSITAPSTTGLTLTKSEITLPSPLFAGSFSYDYEPDIQVIGGNLVFSGDWFQTSHFAAQYGVDFKGYGVGNMRVGLNNIEGKGVDLAVYAKNILDRAYLIAPVVLLQSFPDSSAVYAPPRQYGVELRYNF